jgi:hypothetical protein
LIFLDPIIGRSKPLTSKSRERDNARPGRALVRIERADLAARAGVTVSTVRRLEAVVGAISSSVQAIYPIVRCLEAAGVEFTNAAQPGVRVNKLHKFKGDLFCAIALAASGDEEGAMAQARSAYQAYRILLVAEARHRRPDRQDLLFHTILNESERNIALDDCRWGVAGLSPDR